MASHAHKQPVSSFSSKHHSKITQYIIDSMRLEGVTIDQETLMDFEACDRGEMTEEECYEKGIQALLAQQKKLLKK